MAATSLVPYGGGSAMLLQVPPLTPANYTSWAIKVEVILDAKGLWCAVAPTQGAAVDAGKSKTVRATMLGVLTEEMLMQVAMKPIVKEVWDSLKVRFIGTAQVRAARLAMLHGEFNRLRMEDGDELDVYASKVNDMAARYAQLGATLDDAAMVKKLLNTVPDRLYATMAGVE